MCQNITWIVFPSFPLKPSDSASRTSTVLISQGLWSSKLIPEWLIKHCSQHSKALLTQSSWVFHIPPTNQFQNPRTTVKFIPAIPPTPGTKFLYHLFSCCCHNYPNKGSLKGEGFVSAHTPSSWGSHEGRHLRQLVTLYPVRKQRERNGYSSLLSLFSGLVEWCCPHLG